MASGSDGLVKLGTSDFLSVNVRLDSGGSSGMDSDWWVAADTTFWLVLF